MERFRGLEVFARAAETRSFVEAGRQLGLSASAIGKSIARLEDRLGVRLLHRSTHSVNLTPEGTVFLARCRRILTEMELATQEVSLSQEIVRGTLRVSLPTWAVAFMPVFARFMQFHPQARLELDLTDRLVDVIGEGYDLVVRTGEVRDSDLTSRVIGIFRHAIVAAPAYIATYGTPIHPEDLLHHRCLHRRHPETGKIETWPLSGNGETIDLDLPIAAVANSVEGRIKLAEQAAGIICVPALSVSSQIESGALVSLLQDYVRETGVLRLLWPASDRPAHNVRTLIDFIAQSPASRDR